MPNAPASATWQRLSTGAVRLFHEYANWLVGISWKRFIVLSVLLLIVVNILVDLPPFTWHVTEVTDSDEPSVIVKAPQPPKPSKAPTATPGGSSSDADGTISI